MTIICFSHLRWNFVYQRPQHLLTRFAKQHTIYFIEEPLYSDTDDQYVMASTRENIHVITPLLNKNDTTDIFLRQGTLLKKLMHEENISEYIFWYYSPTMFFFGKHLFPSLIIYDCMDELSAFKFAPPELKIAEQKLFEKADIVFTGGYSLYNAKKHLHHNIYPFPSSIEREHFFKARLHNHEPADQQYIPYPRLGFFGVLDERFDVDLIREAATKKPEWNFIFIGPVIKIHPDDLPPNENIFYLGSKPYDQLPAYISGWDIALIPFAINESTKFISPTKTPEYLAAGKPVISTAIKDVVDPYGKQNLVSIIHSAHEFVEAAEQILKQTNKSEWLDKADEFLADNSWQNTFTEMNSIIKRTLNARKNYIDNKKETYV
jgi:glycosyltransferase involved in cell wall biosynthesis